MNNNKNTSFETKKKYEKKSNIYRIFKYKTYRNSQEKAQLKYYKKPKLKQIDKKINSLSLKANSKEKNLKKIYKPLYSYKITIKNFYKILNKDLRKYNFSHKKYNIKKSNEIIFDKNKRIVSIFKDYLLSNKPSDFLKEYYQIPESISLLLVSSLFKLNRTEYLCNGSCRTYKIKSVISIMVSCISSKTPLESNISNPLIFPLLSL